MPISRPMSNLAIAIITRNKTCTWKVRSIPTSKTHVEEIKPSNTSELLCSSIGDPPQHATIISKYDCGVSNNYWQTEDMTVLTNVKNTRDGPTVQLPNNKTMSTTRTGNTPIATNLFDNAKKAKIFDGLHSDSIIPWGRLCDDDCVAILD